MTLPKMTTLSSTASVADAQTVHARLAAHCRTSGELLSISVRHPMAIRRMLEILTDCPNVLFEGDEVRIGVGSSNDASLLLSEGPDGVICLGPSVLLPYATLAGECPPTGADWLPVSGPRGTYTLICVSATKPMPLCFLRKWRDQPPNPLGPTEIQTLCSWLAGQRKPARITATPYVVFV